MKDGASKRHEIVVCVVCDIVLQRVSVNQLKHPDTNKETINNNNRYIYKAPHFLVKQPAQRRHNTVNR